MCSSERSGCIRSEVEERESRERGVKRRKAGVIFGNEEKERRPRRGGKESGTLKWWCVKNLPRPAFDFGRLGAEDY